MENSYLFCNSRTLSCLLRQLKSCALANRSLLSLLLLAAAFALSPVNATAYTSPDGTATMKAVSWTNVNDTTYLTSNCRFSVFQSGMAALYLTEFSGSLSQVFMPIMPAPDIAVGYYSINLENSLLRWENMTSCGCDGDFYIDALDTTANSIKGRFTFVPACYFTPMFRYVIGEFTIGLDAPVLSFIGGVNIIAKPKDSIYVAMNLKLNDTNVAGAAVYVHDPFSPSSSSKLVGYTNAAGNVGYGTNVLSDALPDNYHLNFWATKDEMPNSDTIDFVVTVSEAPSLVLTIKPSEDQILSVGDSVVYNISVLDNEGEQQDSVTIMLTNPMISNEPYSIGMCNSDGIINYKFLVEEETEPQSVVLKFFAEKEGFASSSEIVRNIEIVPPKIFLTVLPSGLINKVPKDTLTFSIWVRDAKNRPIADATIYVKDSLTQEVPRTLVFQADTSGKAIYKLIIPEKKEGEFEFTFAAKKIEYSDADTVRRTLVVAPEINCWAYLDGLLEFCVEGEPWTPDPKDPKISTVGIIRINDFLVFEGKMTIDTVEMGLNATGKFYLKDIPLPGGGIGTFDIAEGAYDLTFGGKDGKITNFLNEKLGKIAGFEMKFTNIQLVGGRKATGIKVSASLAVPGISVGCNDDGEQKKTQFEVTDLEFKRDGGITIGGFKAENLGFISFPNFCINELSGSYSDKEDKLAFGCNVKIPFGEIGGGLAFVHGELDSVGFKVEASFPPLFVIGTTSMGIMGCFGHISGITQPEIELELGGIMSDILIEDMYKINMSGIYKTSKIFALKGEGTFFKEPINSKWQIKGEIEGSMNFPVGLLKLKGDLKVGTKDEISYLISSSAELNYNMYQKKFAGKFKGELDLPKFDSGWPYDWINSAVGLPKKASTEARFIYGKSKVIWGDTYFGKTIGNLNYVLNLEKAWDDPDFFFFERQPSAGKISIKQRDSKNDMLNGQESTIVPIPSYLDRFVIRISSTSDIGATEIVSPDGTSYLATSADSLVILSISPEGNKAFWTLLRPAGGDWTLKTNNANNHEIDTYQFDRKPTFILAASQTERRINLMWMQGSMLATDSIDIFLDDDASGEDGQYITTLPAQNGIGSFFLADSLDLCKYYIYGIYRSNNYALASYCGNTANNPKSILLAPTGITANFFTKTNKCSVQWESSVDPDVVGYSVYLVDLSGNEQLVANANKYQNSVVFDFQGSQSDRVKVISYNQYGATGCFSNDAEIITSVNNFDLAKKGEKSSRIELFPNPVSNNLNIRYLVNDASNVSIKIVDLLGEELRNFDLGMKNTGIYEFNWVPENIPSSVYYIIFQSGEYSETKAIRVIK